MEFDITSLKYIEIKRPWVYTYTGLVLKLEKVAKIEVGFHGTKRIDLYIYKKDGIWHPADVEHKGDGNCLLCDGEDGETCDIFKEYIDELFENVMNHKLLRMKMVFLN